MENSISLNFESHKLTGTINLPASKSISNRLLIIQALAKETIHIGNLSASDDTQTLLHILQEYKQQKSNAFSAKLAGTTSRFLTAFFAQQNYACTLTGSDRLLQRPIEPLVEALKKLGASIDYKNEKGYLPLEFSKGELKGGKISLDSSVSSQFITALMLIGPYLKGGLEIELLGNTVSEGYIITTIQLMQQFGAVVEFQSNIIKVAERKYSGNDITVEADWSAASYFYSFTALANEAKLLLPNLQTNSVQSDCILPHMFEGLGVKTKFTDTGIVLTKTPNFTLKNTYEFDCLNNPDLAQTLACTCAGLGVKVKLTGLQTLRIKETDRLTALQAELLKFGVECIIDDDALIVNPTKKIQQPTEPVITYDDHRMAMAFAPLAIKVGELAIANPDVVTKSFPDFWKEIKKMVTA